MTSKSKLCQRAFMSCPDSRSDGWISTMIGLYVALFAEANVLRAQDAHVESVGSTGAPAFLLLGELSGGSYYSSARSVSRNAMVIVGTSNSANGPEAFRWTPETGIVGLGDIPGGEFEKSCV